MTFAPSSSHADTFPKPRTARAARCAGIPRTIHDYRSSQLTSLCCWYLSGSSWRRRAFLMLVVKHVQEPGPRAVVLALFARALAGAGFDFEAESLRRRAVRQLERNPMAEPLTRWHLADAERLVGKWDVAESEARRAVEVAEEHNDRETEVHARRLLAAITSRETIPPNPPRSDQEFRELVLNLKSRVTKWSPRRAGRRRRPWGIDWAA